MPPFFMPLGGIPFGIFFFDIGILALVRAFGFDFAAILYLRYSIILRGRKRTKKLMRPLKTDDAIGQFILLCDQRLPVSL